MKKRKSKDLSDLGGMVYSTEKDFDFSSEDEEVEEVDHSNQRILVKTDRKNRKGKTVSLIQGFEGSDSRLLELSKRLKSLCGTGGGVKNGEIFIQGDFKSRIADFLVKEGFNVKISG